MRLAHARMGTSLSQLPQRLLELGLQAQLEGPEADRQQQAHNVEGHRGLAEPGGKRESSLPEPQEQTRIAQRSNAAFRLQAHVAHHLASANLGTFWPCLLALWQSLARSTLTPNSVGQALLLLLGQALLVLLG